MGMIQIPQKSIEFFKNNMDEIFRTGSLAEGKWNINAAKMVSAFTGSEYSTVVNSNGAGIVALLQIYNRYYGRNKVLLQANTMYGVKTMVKSGNCELVGYMKCSIETLMPTLKDVQEAINFIGDTEELIILVTHIGGLINPDIESIAKLCREKNIVLLEDCAHSYGSTHNKIHSGLFGDAGVYSFYSTKAVFTGEGGVIVTKNQTLGNYLSKFIIYDRFEQQMDIGINIRQSELQALMLYSVLQEVGEIISNKKKIASRYSDICKSKGIRYLDQDTNISQGNHYKFILLDDKCDVHNTFKRIQTKTSSVYDYTLGGCSNIPNCHICLPIWYNQDEEITQKVIKELQEI